MPLETEHQSFVLDFVEISLPLIAKHPNLHFTQTK